jgi:hypothetical protein
MKGPRNSTVSLMYVVGIVALNLTLGRFIFEGEPWRLAGLAPIAVIIQLGLFFLIRSRGRVRRYAFWAGFEVGGLLGFWSFLYARVPESRAGSLWDNYGAFIDDQIRTHFGLSVLDRNYLDPVLLTAVAVFAFLPQLCMALIGSLLGLSLAWSARSRAVMIMLFAMVGILILNLAAWLAVWNVLPAQPPWLPFGITPGGLLLQLGLFSLIWNWGCPRRRAFWVGFVVVDSLVFWSYLQATIFNPIQTARYLTYWPNGPWYARPIPEAPLWTLWIDYTALASYALGQQPHGTYIVVWTNGQTDSVFYMLIVLLPHVLAAFVGGAMAVFVTHFAGLRVPGPQQEDHRVADAR